MTGEFAVPAWLAALVLAGLLGLAIGAVALLVVLRRTRRHTDELMAGADDRVEELRHHLTELEDRFETTRATTSVPVREDEPEYLITGLGEPEPAAPMLPGPVFADRLARESVIRAASLAAGLRRALAPETRNRIRFEMKREVKRSRKQRRADVKQAVREWEDRQRRKVA